MKTVGDRFGTLSKICKNTSFTLEKSLISKSMKKMGKSTGIKCVLNSILPTMKLLVLSYNGKQCVHITFYMIYSHIKLTLFFLGCVYLSQI